MKTFFQGLFLLVSVTYSFSSSAQQPSSKVLLARAAEALRTEDYRARVTYEHSGKLDVLEILHANILGREYERINYLNGPPRSISGNVRSSSCVTNGFALLKGLSLSDPQGVTVALEKSYRSQTLGSERVSGREAWVLKLSPTDSHRFGHIIAVDKRSYLPIKTLVIAETSQVLERIHIITLDTGVKFSIGDFSSSKNSSAVNDCPSHELIQIDVAEKEWKLAWIPAGFVLSNYSNATNDNSMTFSDGIASFSVFLERVEAREEIDDSLTSRAQKGAISILMRQATLGDLRYNLSIVGDIPVDTANKILSSVILNNT